MADPDRLSTHDPLRQALVAEVARKSHVAWVSFSHPEGEVRDRLVWHAWDDDSLVLVVGEAAQPLPGLAEASSATVALRSRDSRALLVTCPCAAQVVAPQDDRWAACVEALLAARLNLTDPAVTRNLWRESATVVRLTPTGGGTQQPG